MGLDPILHALPRRLELRRDPLVEILRLYLDRRGRQHLRGLRLQRVVRGAKPGPRGGSTGTGQIGRQLS